MMTKYPAQAPQASVLIGADGAIRASCENIQGGKKKRQSQLRQVESDKVGERSLIMWEISRGNGGRDGGRERLQTISVLR
jgi:hypothetical protein